MFNSEIVDIDRPSVENASYSLKFRGPRLQCRDSFQNRSVYLPEVQWISSQYQESAMQTSLILSTSSMKFVGEIGSFTAVDFNFATEVELNPCPKIFDGSVTSLSDEDTILEKDGNSQTTEDGDKEQLLISAVTTLTRLSKVTECVAAMSEYNVDISFPAGRQVVTYSTGLSERISLPQTGDGFREIPIWVPDNYQPVQTIQEYIDMVALIDSVGMHFELNCDSYLTLIFDISDNTPLNDKAISPCSARREKDWSCTTGQFVHLLSIT